MVRHYGRMRTTQQFPRANISFDELKGELNSEQPMLRVLSSEPLRPPNLFGVAGLILASTAAVVISIAALFTFPLHSGAPGRLVATGAHESTSAQFADGTVMSVGADAQVRVNITKQQRSACVIAGTFMFTVPDLPADFWLDTPVALARIAEAARFRMVVSAVSVDVDVYEGAVLFYKDGVSPEAPVIRIQQGQSYHLSVSAVAALGAAPVSYVMVRSDG